MIQLRDLTLARGARSLLEHVDLQVHAGWRVGVAGANGSGKSSLFELLRGELPPERGSCELPSHWRVASVEQDTPALSRPAVEYVLDGDVRLREVERALASAHAAHDGAQIGSLHAELEALDGYAARSRAATLMAGLGFDTGDLDRPVAEFSGGWRMRLNLARALVSRADLTLLDEPTNHLDLDAVVWLERWLAAYPGTLLVVSHDRDFLDGCTTHTVHLSGRRLTLYHGNYSSFEIQRAAQLAAQQATFVRQQREIARLTRFVERFKAKASKARQAQSRVKALARMERVAAAHVEAPFDFEFPEPERAPDPMLTLEAVAAGYGAGTVLREVRLQLRTGSNIGLLGPNGAGKSTLIRLLAGELAPQSGHRVAGHGLQIGYFAQHQLEQLDPEGSPLSHLTRIDPRSREQELRDYLGGFDFGAETAEAPVARFSGGERARLVLALLVRQRPNLLLLDEPTNHLDLEMRHALTRALAGFPGSMVLVSHDRSLLRSICDRFLLVADGRVSPFDGDLEDYLEWLTNRRAGAQACAAPGDAAVSKAARVAAREAASAERQARLAHRRPLIKESAELETRLARLTAERDEVERALADPALYQPGETVGIGELARRQARLAAAIATAEERWLAVQLELEDAGDG
ncbi:MAG: ABC transporter ATP-binding protein [Gammaproteobacteria bacterium SG8_30]|nr:MAG: ABC transporter ATP-binding protein [Gammaproteobacteria bacterium SG8_30]